jgi:hypothetical protein
MLDKEEVLKLVEDIKEHYKKDPFHGSDQVDKALTEIILFKDLFTVEEFDNIVSDIYNIRVNEISLRKDSL